MTSKNLIEEKYLRDHYPTHDGFILKLQDNCKGQDLLEINYKTFILDTII